MEFLRNCRESLKKSLKNFENIACLEIGNTKSDNKIRDYVVKKVLFFIIKRFYLTWSKAEMFILILDT